METKLPPSVCRLVLGWAERYCARILDETSARLTSNFCCCCCSSECERHCDIAAEGHCSRHLDDDDIRHIIDTHEIINDKHRKKHSWLAGATTYNYSTRLTPNQSIFLHNERKNEAAFSEIQILNKR